ncbi:hypothetical protein LJC08_03955 [Methanimicrococcus sp. OttesenSCG-928-J09]|nr:hypothetical protein [Methanimicrococcus sp. OttesenSCG-928-J09]
MLPTGVCFSFHLESGVCFHLENSSHLKIASRFLAAAAAVRARVLHFSKGTQNLPAFFKNKY